MPTGKSDFVFGRGDTYNPSFKFGGTVGKSPGRKSPGKSPAHVIENLRKTVHVKRRPTGGGANFVFGRGDTFNPSFKFGNTVGKSPGKSPGKKSPGRSSGRATENVRKTVHAKSLDMNSFLTLAEQNRALLEKLAKDKAKLKRSKEILLRRVNVLEEQVRLLESALNIRRTGRKVAGNNNIGSMSQHPPRSGFPWAN